jgi:ApaG protein
MPTAITKEIQVSVNTFYSEVYSRPLDDFHLFSYEITIVNNSPYAVKLMRRHWFIVDSHLVKTEVEGEGVVGEQPEIESGESYTYNSACNITSKIGKMYGTYLFKRMLDDSEFEVEIPEFKLTVPFVLN